MSDLSESTSFTDDAKAAINVEFNQRCVLCLTQSFLLHTAYILRSELQVEASVQLGLLRKSPSRREAANAILLCPTCHLSYMTGAEPRVPPLACFVPCLEILEYIQWCLAQNPNANIEDILDDLRSGLASEEHSARARPFLDMYQLRVDPVTPNDTHPRRLRIMTDRMPPPVILSPTGTFVPAPSPANGTTYKIFDASAVPSDAPDATSVWGTIPILPPTMHDTDGDVLLWHIPGTPGRRPDTKSENPVVYHSESLLYRLKGRLLGVPYIPPNQDPKETTEEDGEPARHDYVAPRPHRTPREKEEDGPVWTFGPDSSSTHAIQIATGTILPEPWHQRISAEGEPVPLAFPSPFDYPGAPGSGQILFHGPADSDDVQDDSSIVCNS
ncbi:hypothetical protein FB451DRAFT_1511140 [Mycena latifolia]|nr:hypothetical protein FB451DRAFT_1511140 [Mycena latifolia]